MIASSGQRVLAVQVKGGRHGRISDDDAKELGEWAEAFNATPILARKKKGRWVLVGLKEE